VRGGLTFGVIFPNVGEAYKTRCFFAVDFRGAGGRVRGMDSPRCKWTNASGDFNAANPDNWEGGKLPVTVEDWAEATPPLPAECAYLLTPAWPRPIPVSERLPPNKENCDSESVGVLAYEPNSDCWGGAAIYHTQDGSEWLWDSDWLSGVPTHWLPLPPKPE
jgi:hypothetical protein